MTISDPSLHPEHRAVLRYSEHQALFESKRGLTKQTNLLSRLLSFQRYGMKSTTLIQPRKLVEIFLLTY